MKKKTIVLGIAAVSAGLVSLKKVQATKENRSLRSLVVDDVIKHRPDTKAKVVDEYRLPVYARLLYKFKSFAGRSDTFELTPRNYEAENVIFYLHGGGYQTQPSLAHFSFLSRLSQKLNARIILPVYPKAPKYKAEDVHAMVLQRYRDVLNRVDPKTITIMGDSAGGGFALSFLQVLKAKGMIMPKRAVLLSPWLDISNTNPDMVAIEPYDVMLDIERIKKMGESYVGSLDVLDPLVSPLYGDCADLVPIQIIMGTHDILYPDACLLYKKAVEEDWDIALEVYPKMGHDFSLYPTPEAKDALNKIASFIKPRQ